MTYGKKAIAITMRDRLRVLYKVEQENSFDQALCDMDPEYRDWHRKWLESVKAVDVETADPAEVNRILYPESRPDKPFSSSILLWCSVCKQCLDNPDHEIYAFVSDVETYSKDPEEVVALCYWCFDSLHNLIFPGGC